jgi:hypothetical protein
MDVLFLSIATIFATGATVAAVVALCRGERFGKTLKTWITRIIDAISGAG